MARSSRLESGFQDRLVSAIKDIFPIMDRIITFDKILNRTKEQEE